MFASNTPNPVLILVLMEDTLREIQKPIRPKNQGLNPCSNGRYSQRNNESAKQVVNKVLILVLMEDTLRG